MPIMKNEETRFCADCSTLTPVKYMATASDNRGLLCRRCRRNNALKAKQNAQTRLFGQQTTIFDAIPERDRNARAEFDALFR